MLLLVEQCLNGLQFGLLLFLLAAGLTLTFGIMDLVNLAHGSLYMMGAYIAWTLIGWTDSFMLGAVLALPATFLLGIAVEAVVMRRLYARDHLDQVLATFGLILFFNELVRAVWGPAGKSIAVPGFLARTVEILPGMPYPAYRFAIIVAFVIIVIGGIGSIKGAFVAAMVVGQIDIIGRAFLPDFLKTFLSTSAASSAAPAISQVLIYIVMAGVLVWRPTGLFGQRS